MPEGPDRFLWLRAAGVLLAAAAGLSAQTLSVVSAASFDRDGTLAPEMIATGFSAAIGARVSVGGSPLPFTLAGYSISIRDSAGREAPAPLFSVANGQISFLVPGGTASGNATVSLRGEDRVLAAGPVRIAAVAPGIFTANASGSGAAAGLVLTAGPDGARTVSELFQRAEGGAFLPRPFTLDAGEVYLLLFGTGIRGQRSGVTATIGGQPAPVSGAAAQGTFAGLDQVNLGPLAHEFSDHRGELEVVVTVDGVPSNRVTIAPNPPALGEWGTRAPLLEANSEMAVAEVGGKIFVLGGYPSDRQTTDSVQVYDPVGDGWGPATPMPIALNHNMAAPVNGRLYLIGGQTTDAGAGNFSDRVFEYNPATRAWRERARMPTARGAGVAVVVEGRIYVAGGRPPRGADFAVYDPQTDLWRVLPDLPTARNHLAGAAIGGRVYIAGGRFQGGFQSPQSDALEVYDPATNSWSARAAMPRPRGGINGLEAHGCLHVFGGEGNSSAPNGLYADHDVYNPTTDTWTSLDPMPVPVHGVTGAVFLSGLIYLPGGGTSQGGSSGGLQHQVNRPGVVCR
ncbi:MAG: hypothetical protein HYZ57_01690 [Acidobacteria bacterium]|nr:hypothetical protein [Acidobacteriota bacterium]